MTHTPGPWLVDANKNVMASGGLVAFPGIAAGFDQEANAALIAAAPELLEMLRVGVIVLEKVEPSGDPASDEVLTMTIETAKAAIAKATGATP